MFATTEEYRLNQLEAQIEELKSDVKYLEKHRQEHELQECNLRDRVRVLEGLLLLEYFQSELCIGKDEMLKAFKNGHANDYRLTVKTTDVPPYLKVELEKVPS